MQRTVDRRTGYGVAAVLAAALLAPALLPAVGAAAPSPQPAAQRSQQRPARFDLRAFQAKVKQAVTDLEKVRRGRPDRRVPFSDLARLAIVEDPRVMKHLRPVLKRTRPEVYAIARAITPVLISLQDKKVVDFPRTELLFAAAAHLLADEQPAKAAKPGNSSPR